MQLRGSTFRRRIDYLLGMPLLWGIGLLRRRRPLPPDSEIQKIGLLQTAAIGDTLLMAGAIRYLRQRLPHSKIVLILGTDNIDTANVLPPVDELSAINVFRPWKAWLALRKLKIDVLIDYGTWPRINALLCAFSGAKFTTGFITPKQGRHFAYDACVLHSNLRHEMENQKSLLTFLGRDGSEAWESELIVSKKECPSHLAVTKFIIIHPWASGSGKKHKEWLTENWVQLCQRLYQKNFTLVITGGKSDIADSENLVSCILKHNKNISVYSLAGQMTLAGTASLIYRAMATISVNTGIMHLASLLEIPTVGLHGPTNPKRWGPMGVRSIAVTPNEGISGYLNLGFEFPKIVDDAMARISVCSVEKALEKILLPNP